jgi:DNA adenine methylase
MSKSGRSPVFESSTRPLAAKPFLRWAGGKRWLLRSIRKLPVASPGKYLEPFVGSGVMYFALDPPRAILSDINQDLITTYETVRDHVEELIDELAAMRNTMRAYLRIRDTDPSDPVARAARLIYLNKTAWNGLYRVNRRDKFNVPYGHYKNRRIVDADGLRSAAERLSGVRLLCSDFETVLLKASRGDLIYADPPYVTNGSSSGFNLYSVGRFSWEGQTRLARVLSRVNRSGTRFILSNRDDPAIRELYRDFSIMTLARQSVIAGDPMHRQQVTELLISNFPVSIGS